MGSGNGNAPLPCPKGDGCALNKGAVTCKHCGRNWPPDETWVDGAGYDYEADIARGSNIRKPGERPWEASRRLRRERGLDV